jgi:hypothetical protein
MMPNRRHKTETGIRSLSCPRVFIDTITVTVAMIDATDRSKAPLPIRITKVWPIATIPKVAAGVKIFLRFCGVRNAGERNEEKIKRISRNI